MAQAASLEVILRLEPTPAGIAAGRRALDELEGKLSSGPRPSFEQHNAVTLLESFGNGTLAPEVLKVLPAGKDDGLTPEEIGNLIDNPYEPGTNPDKASVRGAIRIIQRKQRKLAAQGKIAAEGKMDGEVLHWDWSRYDRDGAGRYFIDMSARTALDRYIAARKNGT
jgi:hypothetical protein